ncbi:MAG: LytTR family DNA-binding domain-containing protein [Oscillospiraceae bacterium]
MKITIQENSEQRETEVVIHCGIADNEIAGLVALLQGHEKRIAGERDGNTHLLSLPAILYFDSVNKKTFAYTDGEIYALSLRLYELEGQLPQNFFRASKASIINIDKIASIRPDFGSRLEVTLTSGERLVVSRQYAQELKNRLEP